MFLEGKIDIEVPIGQAWEFLMDINKFSTCLPGVERLTQVDDSRLEGTLAATVGPISGKFDFRTTIIESKAPEVLVVRTEGTDSVTKSTVNADLRVVLRGLSASATQMHYAAEVKVNGRLAVLGDTILRATATVILQEFGRRLDRALTNPTAAK